MDKFNLKPRDVNLSGEIEDFLDFRNVHLFRISKIGNLVQIFKISQIVPISYIAKLGIGYQFRNPKNRRFLRIW